MKQIAILQFPGTNCDLDTKYAFDRLGCKTHIVWHKENSLPKKIDLVVIAGGFSYGDYLRSGAIAKFSPIMKSVAEYANRGGKVLGICNGFQILTEARLLPGALKRNNNLHFISKFSYLKVINNDNIFLQETSKNEILNIPIAHRDGNFYIDKNGLKELEKNNQILLKYCDKDGVELNINGSIEQIAGICNKEKNVFGLMPHPERAIEELLGCQDGIKMLQGFFK